MLLGGKNENLQRRIVLKIDLIHPLNMELYGDGKK